MFDTFAVVMKTGLRPSSSRPVAIWLLIGVAMLIIQVLLGGITRLTGSGLSITEWKPILGILPPLNDHQWNEAFGKYRQIAQYKYLNSYFDLQDFKSIYFWEWLHRLWARLIGVVFIIPFIFFLLKGQFQKSMIRPLVILFLLGALQGLVGWIMVASGLEDSDLLYVSHFRLAIHFILALILICYTLWFALQLLVPPSWKMDHAASRKFTVAVISVLVLQLIYGAFMAGLKAGPAAPTWPDINGSFLPGGRWPVHFSDWWNQPLYVQFIHRLLAYIILILVAVWFLKTRSALHTKVWKNISWIPLGLVCLQIVLGVFTVLNAPFRNYLLWLGVAHQFTAMLLLLSFFFLLFLVFPQKK